MSRYIVWDAGKETANIINMDIDYTTKKVTTFVEQRGVKALAIVHSLCGPHNNGMVVSPGEYEKQLNQAKDRYAMHNQEQTIKTDVPVNWTATDESIGDALENMAAH